MKFTLIMLFVALSFVGSLYKRFKRTIAETADADRQDDMQFDEQEPVFEQESTQENPYFSYEYEQPTSPSPAPVQVKKQRVAAAPLFVTASEQPSDFDLRQAVVFQTILNNPYIDELNQ